MKKKFKRNITRLGIPTGRRRISWLFHMCGRGFELGTTAIQSSQRLVRDLNSRLLDYEYSALTSRPRCFLISSNCYGFPPSLTGSCFLVSLRLPICKWKLWQRASSYVVAQKLTLGTTLNLWCVTVRLLFQRIFYFRRERNTLDASRFIKVVDHRNDCQNVETRASPRRVVQLQYFTNFGIVSFSRISSMFFENVSDKATLRRRVFFPESTVETCWLSSL